MATSGTTPASGEESSIRLSAPQRNSIFGGSQDADAGRGGPHRPVAHKLTCRELSGQGNLWGVEPVIAESARKHGVAPEDILHAFRNPVHVFELDDGLTLVAGPDRAGALMEVGFVVSVDGVVVIVHAIAACPPQSSSGDAHAPNC